MIVNCPECNKKFIVQDQMIPAKGRHLQCGKCNHVWFFQLEDQIFKSEKINNNTIDNLINENRLTKNDLKKNKNEVPNDIVDRKKNFYDNEKIQPNRSMIVTKDYPSKKINFLKVFLLLIITFIAIIILLDTFKPLIENFFPNIDLILNSLYETIKDINLFLRDLIS